MMKNSTGSPVPISQQVKMSALSDNHNGKEIKKYILIIIAVAVVAGFVGFSIGASRGSGVVTTSDAALRAQIERAKQFFPQISDVRAISGTVTEIRGNLLVLKADPLMNPFDEAPETRIVMITDATTIIKQISKDPDKFQRELEAYQSKLTETPSEDFTPLPSPFTEETLLLSDIAVGNRVSVEAAENIKTAEQFTAVRIVLQESFAIPPPPPTSLNQN